MTSSVVNSRRAVGRIRLGIRPAHNIGVRLGGQDEPVRKGEDATAIVVEQTVAANVQVGCGDVVELDFPRRSRCNSSELQDPPSFRHRWLRTRPRSGRMQVPMRPRCRIHPPRMWRPVPPDCRTTRSRRMPARRLRRRRLAAPRPPRGLRTCTPPSSRTAPRRHSRPTGTPCTCASPGRSSSGAWPLHRAPDPEPAYRDRHPAARPRWASEASPRAAPRHTQSAQPRQRRRERWQFETWTT